MATEVVRKIKNIIPRPIRMQLRKHYPATIKILNAFFEYSSHVVPDAWERITGKRDALTPPQWMNFVGGGNFKQIGEEFYHYFVDICRIKPNENVLEVGCGIGRMAIPLMNYLKGTGSYDGFDIVPRGIHWCQKKITRRSPNFRFQLADIYNYGYNPTGTLRASDYRFPYQDESFDFVFLTSVFTHMLPPDMEHYLSEIHRVLRKGGRCFITFFLLNLESLALVQAAASAIDFKYEMEKYAGFAGYCQYSISDPYVPEAAVAYQDSYIEELFKKIGFSFISPVYYGSWCGRPEHLSFQDIIVAEKTN